jgi:Flp pilus assembly protein TadG
MTTTNNRKGFALVWSALLMLFMTGLAGLSIDWAYVTLTKSQLQAAADAAALASVQQLSQGSSVVNDTAVAYAMMNNAAQSPVFVMPGVDVLIGQFNTTTMQFTVTSSSPNAVKVVARRTDDSLGGPVALLFGPAVGVPTAGASAQAIAMVQSKAGTLGLLSISEDDPSMLSLVGSVKLLVQGGSIQVNTANAQGLTVNGAGTITATSVGVVGGYKFTGGGGTSSPLQTGVPSMANPLDNLDAPTVTNNLGSVSIAGNQSKTIGPGYYPGGISASGNSHLTMSPGIYNIGGAGLQVSTSASMSANGVMLYFSGTTATINVNTTGAVTLTPVTAATSSQYAGISVFQNETSETGGTISGGSNLNLDGTIYMPEANLTLNGKANGGTFGAQVIAHSIKVTGTGTVKINFANGTKYSPGGTSNPALVQ